MQDDKKDTDEFVINQGDPIFHLFTRAGLAPTDASAARKAILFYTLIGWVPLFILAFIQQKVLGISPHFSIFVDSLVYVRLLIVVIVLFAIIDYLNPGINMVVRQFYVTGVIRTEDYPRYVAVLDEAKRWRDSTGAEIIIIIGAFIGAYAGMQREWNDQLSTWMAIVSASTERITPAGWWYLIVTIPLFQILLYRWLWRLIIWYRLLWGISRLPLQLVPTHPDLMGGIGFINVGHAGFGVLIFAISAIIAAGAGNRLVFQHIQPISYATLYAGTLVIFIILFIAPLLMFTPQLLRTRRQGIMDYGLLAHTYVRAFTAKWEGKEAPRPEQLLGNPDFQSLADMINGYNNVRKMRLIPFEMNVIMLFFILAIVPVIPLIVAVRTLQGVVDLLIRLIMP